MSNDKSLVPIEQKTVEFYDDDLLAIRAIDGHVYVAIGQMCDSLGLDRASQVRRMRGDVVLANGYQGSVKLTYPDGGTQRSGMLRVDLVPIWLTGIRVKSVKADIQPKLIRFKQEAAKVLWEAFQEHRLTSNLVFDDLLKTDSPAVQAYKTFQALTKLARTQILLEAQLGDHAEKIDDLTKRLEMVEDTLGSPDRHITPDQASQISQAVKTIALKLSKISGHNAYGGIYGELYRKFGITSYKQLPAAKFDAAMSWLNEWRENIEGDSPF